MNQRLRVSLTVFLIATSLTPRLLADEPIVRPRLVVLLVFDQLRGDYPARWQEQFTDKGFKRLAQEGAWFNNCHYPYAHTITAPGHASLVTGCSPYKHGIIGNEWYDRAAGRRVTAVGFEKYRQLPEPAKLPKDRVLGVAPHYRLQPSVADALHAATKGKAKIVSLSVKPRSASLMAALVSMAAYWFSELTGTFVTSTYYRDAPHDWVERFNARDLPKTYYGKEWTRFRPDLDYTKLAGKDDAPGEEAKTYGLGKAFPHRIDGGKKEKGAEFFEAIAASPLGNELLLEFARAAIEGEQLGQDDVPDLLMVSFSSNDPVGHLYGPDSQEVFDITLRTDVLIGELLDHLDSKVGKGKYAVVLSADHGICPLPEASLKKGLDAGRIVPKKLRQDMENFLDATYGFSVRDWTEEFMPPCVYLDRKTLARMGVKQADAERTIAAWLVRQPGIEAAYTRSELTRGMPKDKLGAMVWRSYHPERSGDLVIITKPRYFLSSYAAGTTHGAPWDYDTHVPLYAFGPGIRPGTFNERVTPQAAAALLSRFLGIEPPRGAEVGTPASIE